MPTPAAEPTTHAARTIDELPALFDGLIRLSLDRGRPDAGTHRVAGRRSRRAPGFVRRRPAGRRLRAAGVDHRGAQRIPRRLSATTRAAVSRVTKLGPVGTTSP